MKRNGFVLIMCLILSLLLFVVGVAFLGLKANQYRSATRAQLALQAKAMAEAGFEDFRLKLDRDLTFPPASNSEKPYSYREELDISGTVRGSYTVSVDSKYLNPPYQLLIVTSIGEVGPTAQTATARRALRFEVDTAAFSRSASPVVANPDYRRIIRFQDLGSL